LKNTNYLVNKTNFSLLDTNKYCGDLKMMPHANKWSSVDGTIHE